MKQTRAEYMREYRKGEHYKLVELPKHRLRNKLNAKRWQQNKHNREVEKILEAVRKINSTYLHQKDFIPRVEVLEVIKSFST